MRILKAKAFRAICLAYLAILFFSFFDATPSMAQYTSGHALTRRYSEAPSLQGATMGTIGPEGNDATFVTGVNTASTGVNTAGTVRVNNLAMVEALINIVTDSVQTIMILWGSVVVLCALRCFKNRAYTNLRFGSFLIEGGLFLPALVHWLIKSLHDASLL